MVLPIKNRCEKCGEKYTNANWKWCNPCQINYLKHKFTNWTSGNEKIDNLIQEMQLKISESSDIIFEWIPYNQFIDIEEIGDDGFAKIYSAIWKDGPLYYKMKYTKYTRKHYEIFVLKCLNSQNFTGEILNKVKDFSFINLI